MSYITQEENPNPIFSNYKSIDKNFNENMDEYVQKTPYENFIEEQKQLKPVNNNVNVSALNNIPVVPEMALQDYNNLNKLPEWFANLNVATPDEIEAWRAKGKMGIAETWQKKKKWEMIPFAGTSAEATLMVKNANTLRKLKKGEEVSDVDKEQLVDFLRDVKELEVRGGHTIGGGAVNIFTGSLPYLAEFGAGLATTESGVGFAALSKTLSTIGARKAARAALKTALKDAAIQSTMTGVKKQLPLSAAKNIYKTTAAKMTSADMFTNVGLKTALKEGVKATPNIVTSSAKMSLTRMPQHFIGNIADRQLSPGVYVTDAGNATFMDSESLALSIMKAFASTTFDTMTETAGWMFAPVARYFAVPIRKALPQKFFTNFDKLVASQYGKPAAEVLKKHGYDGVIEEMGEEVLNRFLCQTFGLNGLNEYNFDGFMNNVFYANDPSQWGAEALAFGATSFGGHAIAGASSKIAEQWGKRQYQSGLKDITDKANKRIYSPEQFYLEQGLIKIKGSQSLAEQKLREQFRKRGIDTPTADEFCRTHSESEIRESLKNILSDQTPEEVFEKNVKDMADTFIQQGLYNDTKKAEQTARLGISMLTSLSEKTGKSIEELVNTRMAKIQNNENIEMFADENGILHSQDVSLDEHIKNLVNEYESLPEDFNDEEQLNKKISDLDILQKIQTGEELSIEDMEQANDLISEYEQAGNLQLAETIRNELNNPQPNKIYHQAAMKRSSFKDFKSFYNNVITNKNLKDKEQFNFQTKDGLNIRIPHDTVLHDKTKHNLKSQDWEELLENIDDISDAAISKQKSSYDGKSILLKVNTPNNTYGVVLETFAKSNPLISTAFIDSEKNIDNWIKNEAIPSGTKTSFLGIRLNNIITNVQPKFKSKTINNAIYFQSAYHGTPHRFDEFSLDSIGTGEGAQAHGWGLYFAENKNVSEDYRKTLSNTNGIGTEIKVDNKIFKKVAFNTYRNIENNYENIDDYFNKALNFIETKGSKKEALKYVQKLIDTNRDAGYYDEAVYYIRIKDSLNEIKQAKINKYADDYGQLFEVDIPEYDVLLDEDKDLIHQPDKVQRAIEKIYSDAMKSNNVELTNAIGITGKEIYRGFSKYFGSDKKASEFLNSYGIKGITYDGRQDGRCYVIFDDKAIKVLKTYYQKNKQNKLFVDNERAGHITNRLTKLKGSFIPAENLITLFKDADESTIVHEFAHWWLEAINTEAQDNEELQEDLNEIRKFVKNNGEEFTEEQHERFARGFEAYMRTGSAKTNRLKKLFEDFKNALLSLYDSIRNLGFDENEIPEINNLFERLLTTENQRIQTAVFNRCNELQTQITEIREKQSSELAEIDEIYNSNLERNLQNNRKKQQVQEYLRLADRATSRIPKAVQDYQKRYKNATFEILEKATGYKRQFIANPKNWEKVQEKIENITDPFSSSDGFDSSWAEFYSDSGVNYDTMDIDGDYNLAYQAFNVLTSNNFLPHESFEGEEEIGKFFGTFDYLAGKVMSLKGENKDAAFEALTTIFDKVPAMPDEAMQEIHEKLNEISNTFIEQKMQENPNKRGLANVSLAAQFRTYVTTKLHEMKAYDPETKRYIRLSEVNKLYSMLKYATDVQSTKEIIRQINSHAIKQLENRQKGILNKEIQKQIKINSKLLKVGALKRGKFDWKTNTVFADLQQMNRLSQEDAKKEYLRLINADSAIQSEERESIEDNPTNNLEAPTDFQKILKMKFLEYKGNKLNDLNLAATRSLLEDIIELKFEGRRAKNEEDLKKALSRYDFQTNLVNIVYDNANNDLAKYIARWTAGDTVFTSEGTLANWESLLTAIFNKETAQKYSLLKSESDVEVYAHRKCLEFYNKALEIYGLRKNDSGALNKARNLFDRALDFDNIQPLVKLFNEYENDVYIFNQVTYNKDTNSFVKTNVELTHAQLITLYAWSLNPELNKRLITQFIGESHPEGEQLLNDIMFSKLSEQDKQFAWAMIDICDSMYEDTNEVFIRTTGLSLPRVDNYIPSKTERIGSDLDMLHENMLRSTNPSFIKQRKNCGRIKMEPQSPLAIILPHINKTARYIVMSEKVNFYNRIFQAPDVKAALIEVYGRKSGTKLHQILLNQLATSTYENYARSITVGKNLIDTVASNYITSRIGGNLKVMFSQLTSVINYAENMPPRLWVTEFTKAVANPKETIEFMFNNCEYLQARLAGNSQNEIISTLTNESDRFRSLRNFCTANTKYGDILAIMFGGKPYVDYLIKNGMTQKEAFEKFVEDTLRSQQSGHNSATSAWQKKQAQNAFTRMIYAFNNTNLQYERKWVDSISNFAKGDISKKEFAKAFLIYKVFNPILFTSFLTNLSLSSLIMGLAGGDDDSIGAFGADIGISVISSNLKAYGFLGILANAIVSAVAAKATQGKYFADTLPLISDFESSMQKLLNSKKLDFTDYVEMLIGAGDYATGIAATRIYNAAGGFGDIAQGDFGVGALRLLGYGKYRATVGATGKEPERKRRK